MVDTGGVVLRNEIVLGAAELAEELVDLLPGKDGFGESVLLCQCFVLCAVSRLVTDNDGVISNLWKQKCPPWRIVVEAALYPGSLIRFENERY